jgi:hypothetical protein
MDLMLLEPILSLGTTIYGTFNFGNDKKIKSIRHVMRPSVSYGYTF